ncbi:hypothetical protein ABPG72_017414 [Tetrahymena utriculariae]
MSKIYEKESQYIVRFPLEIAQKLHQYFDTQKKNALLTKLQADSTNPQANQTNLNQAPNQPPQIVTMPESIEKQKDPVPDSNTPQVSFLPKVVKDAETGLEKLQFDVQVDDFRSKATLIDLPCILETYKTEDTINIFKSNDTKQMIYVHKPEEEDVPQNFAQKKQVIDRDTNEKVLKYESHHGITPPTQYIRKRFYRKKPILDKAEVQEVEKIMVKIQKEITKNDKEPERTKRKYKKRY